MFAIVFILLLFSTGDSILIGKIQNSTIIDVTHISLFNITLNQCICKLITVSGIIPAANYFPGNQSCQLFNFNNNSSLISSNFNTYWIFTNQSSAFITNTSITSTSSPTTSISSSSTTTSTTTSSTTSLSTTSTSTTTSSSTATSTTTSSSTTTTT
ncbi:unnamed protein product, partial [Adineta steineri]